MKCATVNNEVYRRRGAEWWDEDVGEFSTIRFFVNPVRFSYFMRVYESLKGKQGDAEVPDLLDVGCGGGFLSEDFARAGFAVTGIDPAPETVAAARRHAGETGLSIAYHTGAGERLPFEDGRFDCVACCDVLEHVDDLALVVKEIARVLKPGGVFFYDTINRTFRSKVAVIKVMQEWRSTAFAESNSHVWERFIKPAELTALMARYSLENRETRGIGPRLNPVSVLLNLRRCARGQISFRELGRRLQFSEIDGVGVSYMGFAVKALHELAGFPSGNVP